MIKFERLGVVLSPKEGFAKFNAGMICLNNQVHMLYRWSQTSKGENGFPVYYQDHISYAKLTPDGKLIEDLNEPVIFRTHQWERQGCQDPRIVRFEGINYIFYCAYDGAHCRVGIAAADDDFKSIRKIGIIPTGSWDKDAFIFPERINGKIAYIHRFEPNIQIDYFDDIEQMFDESFWNNYCPDKNGSVAMTGQYSWENKKIGGSVPPIKTDLGWLFIYHGVADDREPFCYRMGAALLDIENPNKVISRLPYPILEPTEDYELSGDVPNVVFPCGAYINDDYLYISYGGADKVTALVRCSYNELINELKSNIL